MNFDLGPYSVYIWPAYIISAVALGGQFGVLRQGRFGVLAS